MTYRWPYGPCSYVFDFSASVSLLQDLATAERHLIPARLKHKWYTVQFTKNTPLAQVVSPSAIAAAAVDLVIVIVVDVVFVVVVFVVVVAVFLLMLLLLLVFCCCYCCCYCSCCCCRSFMHCGLGE